jgi:tRNA G10  N-methylase Trm11
LTSGFKKSHLIVTDLPYGIQHRGKLIALLSNALPVWAKLLQTGGVLTFSWDATRFPRRDMIDVVQANSPFIVFDELPYNQLSHQVDRVIKKRDLIVARIS